MDYYGRLLCPPLSPLELLKLMSIQSMRLSDHLILCRPLLFLPSVFPSIRVFSNELALCWLRSKENRWKIKWRPWLLLEVAQSCLTLCNPMDCSLPGFSIHGIFQARVLEWVATPFSWGSSQPRDQTHVSCTVGRRFTLWATREAQVVG